ncbi:hypothetical protein Scep_019182 [Stephania cephalantha]|uniref:Reverse transcriptase domain-containing protein n=1 Tax=Stephania cephalantha TaxID=152367 RepID=A0AAP0IAR0_9MAGN
MEVFTGIVESTETPEVRLEDVPVVSEFPDVFSEDLPGGPLLTPHQFMKAPIFFVILPAKMEMTILPLHI